MTLSLLRIPRYPQTKSLAEQARDAAYRILESSVLSGTLDHDSYAYKARMAAYLVEAGHPDVAAPDVTAILDTLWAARYISGSGNPGFGESVSFDAFSDGTTNPSTTLYTYTTATAALAFLDGYVVSGTSTHLTRAQACVSTILAEMWSFTDGTDHGAWYSNNANDKIASASYYVHNINALTLAAMARIKALTGTSPDATKQGQIESFIAGDHNAGATTGAWYYAVAAASLLNDVDHHSYMVEGTVWDATADASNALTYLWSLFGPQGTFDVTDSNMMGSLNWGPGDALSALSLGASTSTILQHAHDLASFIERNVASDGTCQFALAGEPRSIVRYGLGLARYAARVLGDGSLFP